MKAIVYHNYGSPEVLEFAEVERPTPGDNEVLVRIHATAITVVDSTFRRGDPFSSRLATGLTKPKNAILGGDIAGEIEAVGKKVVQFKVGDRVFGPTHMGMGGHAEYVCLPEDAALIAPPQNLDEEEAVSILYGCLTALPFLRDEAKIQSGQRILINGASGGIGVYAVQLAKYYGAHVTGVCSTKNVDLVRSLGADDVIDYTEQDFTKGNEVYDVVFDLAGKSSFGACRRVLTREGLFLSPVLTFGILMRMLWTSLFGRKKAKIAFTGLRSAAEKRKDLVWLKELIEKGALRPVIDRSYRLDQVIEAHRYIDAGHKRGNVVIQVAA